MILKDLNEAQTNNDHSELAKRGYQRGKEAITRPITLRVFGFFVKFSLGQGFDFLCNSGI